MKRSQPVLTPLSYADERLMEKLLAEPWDEQDWQDLHIAVETVKRKIAVRHARRRIEQKEQECQAAESELEPVRNQASTDQRSDRASN